jgi:hypothetical protein
LVPKLTFGTRERGKILFPFKFMFLPMILLGGNQIFLGHFWKNFFCLQSSNRTTFLCGEIHGIFGSSCPMKFFIDFAFWGKTGLKIHMAPEGEIALKLSISNLQISLGEIEQTDRLTDR